MARTKFTSGSALHAGRAPRVRPAAPSVVALPSASKTVKKIKLVQGRLKKRTGKRRKRTERWEQQKKHENLDVNYLQNRE